MGGLYVCVQFPFFFFAFQINSKKNLWHKFDNLYNTHTQYYDFKWREWYKYPYFGILEPLEKLVLVTWKKLGNTVIFYEDLLFAVARITSIALLAWPL